MNRLKRSVCSVKKGGMQIVYAEGVEAPEISEGGWSEAAQTGAGS